MVDDKYSNKLITVMKPSYSAEARRNDSLIYYYGRDIEGNVIYNNNESENSESELENSEENHDVEVNSENVIEDFILNEQPETSMDGIQQKRNGNDGHGIMNEDVQSLCYNDNEYSDISDPPPSKKIKKSYRHYPQYKSSNIPPVFRSVPRRVEASPPPSIKAALEKVKQYERLSTQRKTNKGTNIDASQRKQNSRRSGRERRQHNYKSLNSGES